MWPRFWKPLIIVIPSAAIVLAVLYMTYRFIDPIPPRHFMIAAGMAASGYDNFARQYARILARDGVALEVRNAAGAVEDLNLLRDGASGVQAALTALGFTRTPSSLRNLRHSGASACPLARLEQRYVHLFSRSWQPQMRWMLLLSSWIWTPPKQSMH
jgi:hypothetical protein